MKKAPSQNRFCKYLIGTLTVILCILWVRFFLYASSHDYVLWSNSQSINLPSYQNTKKEYYEFLTGHKLGSYLPPEKDLRTLLDNPDSSFIDNSYPHYFKLGDLLKQWPSNNTNKNYWGRSAAHPSRGKGLFRLNYMNETERKLAFILKEKDLPYILYNVPEVDVAAAEVFTFDGLQKRFGDSARVVEQAPANEFLYYTAKNLQLTKHRFPSWEPPQTDILMTFSQFVGEAADVEKQRDDNTGQRSLFYMIINAGEGGRTSWIRSALPIFEPVDSLFMYEEEEYRGINCRFGMKGVIATAHYDSRKNYIAMIRGRKRYVLLPPRECPKLELYPRGHPSARHSKVPWSNLREMEKYPDLYNADATEVVLSMGEVLYLPSYWFHYIISQDASIQCNSRSGESVKGKEDVHKCGYFKRKELPDGSHEEEGEEEEEEEEIDGGRDEKDEKESQGVVGKKRKRNAVRMREINRKKKLRGNRHSFEN